MAQWVKDLLGKPGDLCPTKSWVRLHICNLSVGVQRQVDPGDSVASCLSQNSNPRFSQETSSEKITEVTEKDT